MKRKTHLFFCSTHGFALYHEILDATAMPIATCGCFPNKSITSLKEVKKILVNQLYPSWKKFFKFKDSTFVLAGYNSNFWFFRNLKYKVSGIWYNITHLFYTNRDY